MTKKERELAESSADSGRRRFLAGAGSLAGLAMIGSASATDAANLGDSIGQVANVDSPNPYAKMDPESLKPLGREAYHKGYDCGMGCFDAIISKLRENVGEPYTNIPTTATVWSAGGGSGWSAVCGAVVGANTAIATIHGNTETTMKLVDELQRWYTQHNFPQYTPPTSADGITKKLPTSQSGSILCHTSVTHWCEESGYASGADERSERCSRVVADTAAKAVELLNAEANGNFQEVANSQTPMSVDGDKGCRSCHFKGSDHEAGQYTRGKMECMQCHGGAPHMPDSLQE